MTKADGQRQVFTKILWKNDLLILHLFLSTT